MRKLLLSVLVVICSATFAQKQTLELNQLMTNPNLRPQSLYQLYWWNNQSVIYQKANEVQLIDFATKAKSTLFSLKDLNEAMKNAGFDEFKALPRFRVDSTFVTFVADFRWLQFDPVSKSIELLSSIPDNAKNIEVFYPAKQVAYTTGNDNELVLLNDNIKLRVALAEQDGIKNGVAVHRNEFGINKGIFFSPDGQYLAYYTMDESMVTNYPLVDINAHVATVKNDRYPMAGMRSHNVRVGTFNATNFRGVLMRSTFDRETYQTNVSWSPDSKAIYIAMVTRDQKTMNLREYDPMSGLFVKELFQETSPRYVEPMNPMLFIPSNPNLFVWQSQRDGYNHIYLYNTDGKLIRQITQGEWV
ncbi:MAG: DPP IV N-terminal domain-containing protein, partial [Bacteroidales bacterium]|nr:DPP IV N-terminal domain-containing protein [Bacteroidales bacterium]